MLIPEGSFEMGLDEDDPRFPAMGLSNPAASPKHTVQMSAYCIERTEVTVGDYRKCFQTGACERPVETTAENPFCNYSGEPGSAERHPVNCVSWTMARTYCQWLGGDLPSEAPRQIRTHTY